MFTREIPLLAAHSGHRDRALPFQEPDDRSHGVLRGYFDTHMHMVRHQVPFDDLWGTLSAGPEHGRPPPVDDAVARTGLSAVVWGGTPHGICSSISNGIGSGKAGTSHPPFKRSSSHLEEDVMPERSNLFESQWSNQWLTQKRVN